MLHRTLDTYIKAVNEGQSTIAMMMKHSPLDPLFAALKSGFDRGIVQASKLPMFMGSDTFDFLMPLFKVWQDKGLVELQERSLVLTLAGSFLGRFVSASLYSGTDIRDERKRAKSIQ